MTLNGNRAWVGGPARSSVISVSAITLGSLAILMIILVGGAARFALTLGDLNRAGPGALLAVALLLSHLTGQLNLSLGAIFALALVFTGRAEAPSDQRVIAALGLAALLAVAADFIVVWGNGGILAGVLLYFVIVDITLRLGGGSSRASDLDQSLILRFFSSSIGPMPVSFLVALGTTFGLSLMLGRGDLGRQARALGFDRVRFGEVGGSAVATPIVMAAVCGMVVGLAAMLFLSRLGTSGTPTANQLLLEPLAAVILGNGGLGRAEPSPVRVMIAFVVISVLGAELRLGGLSALSAEVAIALAAVVVLLLARESD